MIYLKTYCVGDKNKWAKKREETELKKKNTENKTRIGELETIDV